MAEGGYRSALGATAEEENDDTIRVCVVIEGLKSKAFGGDHESSNATVHVDLEETSFCVTVTMNKPEKGKKEPEKFQHQVKKLPGRIMKDKCTWKVGKDKVVLKLKKAEDEKSWVPALQKYKYLETHSSSESSSDEEKS